MGGDQSGVGDCDSSESTSSRTTAAGPACHCVPKWYVLHRLLFLVKRYQHMYFTMYKDFFYWNQWTKRERERESWWILCFDNMLNIFELVMKMFLIRCLFIILYFIKVSCKLYRDRKMKIKTIWLPYLFYWSFQHFRDISLSALQVQCLG